MSDRDVDLARQEARRRKRAGQAKSYTAALAQLAGENGHDNWTSYAKALAAVPDQVPDFRVRLVGPDGEKTFGLSLSRVLTFHELDESAWARLSAAERVHEILECALSSRRERGDMTRYSADLIESNVPSVLVASLQPTPSVVPASGRADSDPADFVVELERRDDGAKERVGVHLKDVLEYHGLALADWESSGGEEQEALVEEAALWTKRRSGDLGGYFTQVLSGLDGDEESGEAPR